MTSLSTSITALHFCAVQPGAYHNSDSDEESESDDEEAADLQPVRHDFSQGLERMSQLTSLQRIHLPDLTACDEADTELPPCISQLVHLKSLNCSFGHWDADGYGDRHGRDFGRLCLPAEITTLSGLTHIVLEDMQIAASDLTLLSFLQSLSCSG